MEKMRQGNMDIEIGYKSEDELGRLSDASAVCSSVPESGSGR